MKTVVVILPFLALAAGCFPKRRSFGGEPRSDVSIRFQGTDLKSLTPSLPIVTMTGCQKSVLQGAVSGADVVSFLNVPPMTSGTTCTVDISDAYPSADQIAIKWLDKPGLRFRDTQVTVSQSPDGSRSGVSRNLVRMFDIPQASDASTAKLLVKVTRKESFSLAERMDASISCSPAAPYYSAFSAVQFGSGVSQLNGVITFLLPVGKAEPTTYECVGINVFRDYKIVAYGQFTQSLQLTVQPGQAQIEAPEGLDLIEVSSTETDISVKPEVSGK